MSTGTLFSSTTRCSALGTRITTTRTIGEGITNDKEVCQVTTIRLYIRGNRKKRKRIVTRTDNKRQPR